MRHRWHTAWRRAVIGCGAFTTLAAVLGAPTAVDARPFAYVANSQVRTVSVIDIANDSVIATIPTVAGQAALEVAVTPDGNRAYVAGGEVVVVIDTNPSSPTFNTVIRTITTGAAYVPGVAVSPDGTLCYATKGDTTDGAVSVIDTGSNMVTGTIPVGGRPSGVVFTPDSARAYVVNAFSLTLSVIDTASGIVVDTINLPAGHRPEGIAITPDGATLYITYPSTAFVVVVDTATGDMTTIPMADASLRVAISPDGTRAYVTLPGSASSMLAVIDTSSQMVVASVPMARGAFGVAVTPDSARAYVTRFDSAVDAIDTTTNTVVDTVTVQTQPQGIAITPFISDVGITKSGAPDPVMSGGTLTYTLTVTNNGPDPALSVVMTDILPDLTTFVSCMSTGSGVCSGSDANQTVTFARLESGATETITLVARVNDGVDDGTVISNTATISSATHDPDLSNNSSTAVVTVSNPPPTHQALKQR